MANGDVCVQEAEDGESMLLCLQLHVFVLNITGVVVGLCYMLFIAWCFDEGVKG